MMIKKGNLFCRLPFLLDLENVPLKYSSVLFH